MCQQMKNRTKVFVEKLKFSEVLEKLQIYLIVDFIIKLPLVVEKNIILVVQDKLFKIVYFVIIIQRMSAEGSVRLFRDNVQKLCRIQYQIEDYSLQQS